MAPKPHFINHNMLCRKPTISKPDGEPKKLVLDSLEKVELVRRIFREYLSGESLRSLARKLTSEGVPSPSDRGDSAWNPTSVRNILGNQLYTGLYVWNRVSNSRYTQILNGRPEPANRNEGVRSNDDDQWIVTPNNHPAIIDEQTFERVQRRMQERKRKTSPNQTSKFLLTGILRCGHCGSVMYGDASEERYICNGYKSLGRSRCDWYSVKQNYIIDILVKQIQNRLLDPETQKRLIEAIERRVREEVNPAEEEQLRKRLKNLEKKLQKAQERLLEVDRDLLNDVQQGIRQLKSQKKSVESRLREIEGHQKSSESEQVERVKRALDHVKRLPEIVEKANPREVRETLSTTIDRTTLEFRKETRGQRSRYQLIRGTIHLSESFVSELSSAASRVPIRW